MKLKAVRITMGRLAGSVQMLPAAVATRLLDSEQAEEPSAKEAEEAARIQSGDIDITHRDPRGKRSEK